MMGFEKLASCGSRETLAATADHCTAAIGFELWSLALHLPVSQPPSPAEWEIGNLPQELLSARLECFRNLTDADGTAWMQHGLPYRWLSDEASRGDGERRACAEHFRTLARRDGIHGGLCVPVTGVDGAAGSLTLATHRPLDKQRLDEARPQALLFSRYLVRACQPQIEAEQLRHGPPISRRELECLSWVALGKTTWEISRVMEISEHTVVYHLRNAGTKLGAVNRQQAVARSIQLGMLDSQGRVNARSGCPGTPLPAVADAYFG